MGCGASHTLLPAADNNNDGGNGGVTPTTPLQQSRRASLRPPGLMVDVADSNHEANVAAVAVTHNNNNSSSSIIINHPLNNNPSCHSQSPSRRASSEATPTPHSAQHNRQVGNMRWKKGQLLGSGAFGRVYLALNFDTGKLMAAKEVSFMAHDRVAFNELAWEVKLMSQLQHPNIVHYLGTSMERLDGGAGGVGSPAAAAMMTSPGGAKCFIFLEFVPGGSLLSLLQKFGRFNEELTHLYTRQICDGLEYLHENHIIHRDLKPANLLMTDSGVVKLADFGSSVQETNEEAKERKSSGLKGSPYYMAPEAIRNSQCTELSDVWSLGCTVVQFLTGKYPWIEKNWKSASLAMMEISQRDEIPYFPQDSISPRLKAFILAMLARDPTKRLDVKSLMQHDFLTLGAEVTYGHSLDDDDDNDEGMLFNMLSPGVSDSAVASGNWTMEIQAVTSSTASASDVHVDEKPLGSGGNSKTNNYNHISGSGSSSSSSGDHNSGRTGGTGMKSANEDEMKTRTTVHQTSDESIFARNNESIFARNDDERPAATMSQEESEDWGDEADDYMPPPPPPGNPFENMPMTAFADPAVVSGASIFTQLSTSARSYSGADAIPIKSDNTSSQEGGGEATTTLSSSTHTTTTATASAAQGGVVVASTPSVSADWVASKVTPRVVQAWNRVLADRKIREAISPEFEKDLPEDVKRDVKQLQTGAEMWKRIEANLQSRFKKHAANKWQKASVTIKETGNHLEVVALLARQQSVTEQEKV